MQSSCKRQSSRLHCLSINIFLLGFAAGILNEDHSVMDMIQRINNKTDPASEDVNIIETDIRLAPPESAAAIGEFSSSLRLRSRLWPGGVVPYVLDSTIVNRTRHVKVLHEAMKIWENASCVRFVQRTNQRRYARIWFGPRGCNSNIGALWSRPSELSLGMRCDHVSIATHELGHLLGFGHEHSRPDRDEYVDILWENISPAHHKIFKKDSHWIFHSFGTPYDYNSIMHYGSYHFSKNGKRTIVSRKPNVKWFGNRHPSKVDIIQMNLMYSCPEFPIFPDHFSVQSTAPSFYNCIKIDQPRDREWGTRYLCYKPALKNFNIKWSRDGPITGHDCINTIMPYERSAAIWANSFLCVPQSSVLRLIWSTRPLNGRKCLAMRERRSYFLCGELKYGKIDGGWSRWSSWRACSHKCGGGFRMRERSCDSPTPKYGGVTCRGDYYESSACNTGRCPEFPSWPDDFKFLFIGFTPRRKQCIPIYERYQYSTWARAKLCWPSNKRQIVLRWSDSGKIKDMHCTRITERSGRLQSYGWRDNYLCTKNTPYNFRWSTNGPIRGLKCLQWYNPIMATRNHWQNNYLCAPQYPKPKRSARTGCYPTWRPFLVNGVAYCYLSVSTKQLTWEEAQKYCQEEKSNLVSVTSKEEEHFLHTIRRGSVWIGLQKSRTLSWRWRDGSRLEFLNWSHGEPNNGGRSNVPENCAMLNSYQNKWNDFPCSTKFNFICKMRGGV